MKLGGGEVGQGTDGTHGYFLLKAFKNHLNFHLTVLLSLKIKMQTKVRHIYYGKKVS